MASEARLAAGISYPYPLAKDDRTSALMKGMPIRDTKPEIALRSSIHARGLRFRKNVRIAAQEIRVRADIVFPKIRLAVFVDGCFWHNCPQHGSMPKNNSNFWREKFRHNRQRDQTVNAALAAEGWTVLRIWEHVPVPRATAEVEETLRRLREGARFKGSR